jgi:hypothetical protein
MDKKEQILCWRQVPRLYGAEPVKLVQTKSYSSQEENVCRLIVKPARRRFDEVKIDGLAASSAGVGNGPKNLPLTRTSTPSSATSRLDVRSFQREVKAGKVWGREPVTRRAEARGNITAAAS